MLLQVARSLSFLWLGKSSDTGHRHGVCGQGWPQAGSVLVTMWQLLPICRCGGGTWDIPGIAMGIFLGEHLIYIVKMP